MLKALILALLLFAAAPASAQNYSAAPAVSAERSGEGGRARASMDVNAPPAAVWSVLSDCAQARRFMRDLISCRVLDSGQGWDVREHRVRGWPLRSVMRNVSRITLDPPHRLAFSRVEGDWTRSEGEWVLTPIDGGRGTHVEYRIDAAIDSPLPAGVSRGFLVNNVRQTLTALRTVVERQSASAHGAD